MIRWPHGSARVPVDVLQVGDIVVVPAAGAYRINQLLTLPRLGKVAVLGWDDLALILRPGTTRERLNPAPDATRRRTTRTASATSTTVRLDQYRLAG